MFIFCSFVSVCVDPVSGLVVCIICEIELKSVSHVRRFGFLAIG